MSFTTKQLVCCALFGAIAWGCGPEEENKNNTTPVEDMSTAQDMTPEQDMLDPDGGGGDKPDAAPDMVITPDMTPDMDESDMPVDMGLPAEGVFIEGLSAPLKVTFDAQHVPHINCQTNNDCFAAQGYYHAAHRFAQMDVRRRVGSGRLSTLLSINNAGALSSDITNRQLLTTRDGQPLEDAIYDKLDDREKSALDAYARGVNAWLRDYELGRNNAQLSEEGSFAFINLNDIPEWTAQDSLVVSLVFLNSLMDIGNSELNAANVLNIYGEDLFMDFYQGWHLDPDSTIIESAGGTYGALGANRFTNVQEGPRLDIIKPRLRQAAPAIYSAQQRLQGITQYTSAENPFGSNSWATSPAKNKADYALLANDPHLALSNPALWSLVEMDARTDGTGDLHTAGVSFPGLPGVMIGYSEDVAWSATVAYWDLVDVYVEEISADGQGVVRGGQTIPFIKQEYTFKQAQGETTEELLFVPDHGPVIAIDTDAGVAITLKSVLADSTDDLKLFLNMGSTTSLAEAKTLLSGSTAAGFNFVLIDRLGSIAYYPFAGIPRREWDIATNPAWLPLPGDGSAEWGDTHITADELPQLIDPPNNFIATANAGITDDMLDGIPGNAGYPPLQSPFMASGPRQARIVDVLEASDEHDVASYQELQGDTVSWLAQQMLPIILTSAQNVALEPDAQTLHDTLAAWDYTCPTGLADARDPENSAADSATAASASGCAAFHVLLFTLNAQTFKDNVTAAGGQATRSYETSAMYWLLNDPSMLNTAEADYWDDLGTTDVVETRDGEIARAMTTAVAHLDALFGSKAPADWLWGRIHTLTLNADLLSALTSDYNHGPFATHGGLFTVNVANPSNPEEGDGEYSHGAGASMRMIVEGKPDGFVGHFNFPGGQVHRRDSEFYDHLLDDWLSNDLFVMPFTKAEVEAAAVTTVDVNPR